MKRLLTRYWLRYAYLFLSLALVATYGTTEHSWLLRGAVILLGLTVLADALHRYTAQYVELFLLFLLAVSSLYALQQHVASPLVTLFDLLVAAGVVGLGPTLFHRGQRSLRWTIVLSLLTSESILLLTNLAVDPYLPAAIVVIFLAGLEEVRQYPALERWKSSRPYATLILLLFLLLSLTLYVGHA